MLNRQKIVDRKSMISSVFFFSIFLGITIYIGTKHFLFFQVISNIYPIVIGVSVAVIAINTYEISQIQYFTFLGLTYGFVAFFDMMYVITHSDIGLFNYPIDISIKLWLVPRIIQSISLFLSFFNFKFKFKIRLFFIIYFSVTLFSLYIIFMTDIFIASTFTIIFFTILLLALSIVTIVKFKENFDEDIYYLLMFSMFTLLISNAFFINFLGEENIQNAFGYIFKIISFYLLYRAVTYINLKEPYKTLFYKLNENNKKLKEQTEELRNLNERLSIMSLIDPLTGLYNRTYFEQEVQLIEELGFESLAVLIADLDDMKLVNDKHGHLMGDKYLKEAAKVLRKSFRENDTVARVGGDEFAILIQDIDDKIMGELVNRIKREVNKFNMKNNEFKMAISLGWDVTLSNDKSINELIENADNNMYKNKLKTKTKNKNNLKYKN